MAVRANLNLKQRTLMMAGMAIVIIACMVINQVWQTYGVTVATARRNIQQFTQILEANTDITLQAVTLILDHAVEAALDQIDTPPPQTKLTDRFITIADSWAFIHSVSMIGPDGFVRDLALRQADGRLHAVKGVVYASVQPIFTFYRDGAHASDAFYIGRPSPGLVSGEKLIRVTKPLYDEKGAFQGICVVAIAVDAFTNVYAGLLPARYAGVDLFMRDGVLLASTDAGRRSDLTDNEKLLFKDMIPATPSGVYRIASSEGDSGNLVSYRALQRYPIVIAVTANWFQFMERWWESTIVLVASALIGILVIIALTGWLVRRMDAERVAQDALIESERSMMESQRLSGIGYFERVLPHGEMIWSPNMYVIHGLDPDQFTPSRDSYLSYVVEEDRKKVFDAWENIESSPPFDSLECRIVLADGIPRFMRYSWTIHDKNGRKHIFGVAQDVSVIRNAEDTIRDDEERLRDIVECSSDYIWELDGEGVITLFSGAGSNQFGAENGTSRRILSRDTLNEKGGDVDALERSIRNRMKFRSLLVPVRNAKAEVRWIRISGNPRFDTHGKYLGYRGAGTEVTELYRRQQRDEALRKAEALGRLASGMAHEINNLLQPIVIYANLGAAQSEPAPGIRQ